MVYPSLIAAVSDASHPAWRARSLSVYRFWRDLGYAIGALSAGLIADRFGLSWAIGSIAALTFLFGAAVAVLMREHKGHIDLAQDAKPIIGVNITSIRRWREPMQKHLIQFAAAGGTALSLIPNAVWAQVPTDAERYAWGPHMMWWGGGWYAMILGPLFMIVFFAALIAVVVLLVRWLGGPWQATVPPHHAPPGRTPLDILKERFARGEIDKDEFEERRRVLGE